MNYAKLAVAFAALSVLGTWSPPSNGEAFQVNTIEDARDADVADGLCLADNGLCTIRAALEQSNSSPGEDTILIPDPGANPYEMTVETAPGIVEPFWVYDYTTIFGDGPEQSIIRGGGNAAVLKVVTQEVVVLDAVQQDLSVVSWHGLSPSALPIASIPVSTPIRLVGGAPPTIGADYLITTLADGVLAYDADGTYLGQLVPPEIDGVLLSFNDVEFGQGAVAGHMFVSNFGSGGGVYHFSPTGDFIDIWDTGGVAAGAMEWVDGQLVVALLAPAKLAAFDESGARLPDFAPSFANFPRDVVLKGDYLYVAADSIDTVFRIETTTGATEVFVSPGAGGLDSPQYLGFSPSGELLVHSQGTDQILRYDGRTGNFAGVLAEGGDVGIGSTGSFLVRFGLTSGPRLFMTGMTLTNGDRSGTDACFSVKDGAAAIVWDTTIRDCNSSGPGGGFQNHGISQLSRVSITGNSTNPAGAGGQTSQGGGVFNSGLLTIIDSLIANNNAGRGGGVANDYKDSARLDLINTTVTGNTFAGQGAVRVASGTVNIVNSTITNNERPTTGVPAVEGPYASGLVAINGATINIANSIVADNINPVVSSDNWAPDCFSVNLDSSDPVLPGNIISLTDNLIEEVNDACGIVDEFGNFPPDLIFGMDPLLGALADNGGPYMTQYPLPGSPVIDADLTQHALDLYNCTEHDQRLQFRPLDGDGDGTERCDLGAVEVRAATASDSDADGLSNELDVQPLQYSFQFSDVGLSGTTTGMVLSLGTQLLSIEDAPEAGQGVVMSADAIGGSEPALISVCEDEVIIELAAGQSEVVTCITADAGPDQTLECEAGGEATAVLAGLGEALSGGAVTYQWDAPGVALDAPTEAVTSGSFPLGTTVASLAVTRGNEEAVDYAIIEVVDTTPPVITAPPDIELPSCFGGDIGQATASDSCGGAVEIDNDAPATFKAGVWTITWTATDAAGRQAVDTQRVVVGLGEDPACCPTGSNVVLGTSNDDVLFGTSGPDCMLGFGAQDTLLGFGGDDVLSGGEGDDVLRGGSGSDLLEGGNGQDDLFGGAQDDALYGGGGDDLCYGGDGDDLLSGGQGQDELYGDADDDELYGDVGDDTLQGGAGIDYHDGGGLYDQCLDDVATSTFIRCENQASSCNVASYEAETMGKSTGGSVTGGWNIWSNGYIWTDHDFTAGPTTIIVMAQGQPALGVWPHMVVTVDGVEVGDSNVTSTSYAPYTFNFTASGGTAEIRVEFDNDYYVPPDDRNLLVDSVLVDCDGQ